VGAMALFVVLSVFSGLREFSLSFSNNFDPDLKITATLGKSFSSRQSRMHKSKIDGIAASSKIIEERVLFLFNGKEEVTYLKGVDSLFGRVNDVNKIIFNGQWLEPHTQVVVGYGIAQHLSLGLFDMNNPFEVFVPRPGKGTIETPEEAFNKFKIAPVGIYAVSEELDSKYVFADLVLTKHCSNSSSTKFQELNASSNPAPMKRGYFQAQSIFNNKVTIKNRAQLNDSLYKMLNTENVAIYLIFTLVIILILFAFSGSIFMVIIDKQSNLKTLYNLGSEVKTCAAFSFCRYFGLCLGWLFGLAIGSAIVFLQQQFNLVMITPTLLISGRFLNPKCSGCFLHDHLLGFVASWIASSRVTKKLLE
jgi:lipoprotein-releasing system permease protein